MKILSVVNQKGGVGKTTTSINLSACLYKMKRRVLLVDLDPQSNATRGSGIDASMIQNSINDVLLDRVHIEKAIIKSQFDGYDILPATPSLTESEVVLVTRDEREFILKNKLSSIKINDEKELENFRLEYLSKKGLISSLFSKLKEVSNENKKLVGQQINEVKILANEIFDLKKNKFSSSDSNQNFEDYSKPTKILKLGSRHPISIVKNKITDIFLKIGFDISEGPEIEDDWHNFTALSALSANTL